MRVSSAVRPQTSLSELSAVLLALSSARATPTLQQRTLSTSIVCLQCCSNFTAPMPVARFASASPERTQTRLLIVVRVAQIG